MKLNFKVSEKGVKDAIQKGVEIKAAQTLEVDLSKLTAAQRTQLARHTRIDQDQMWLSPFGKYIVSTRDYPTSSNTPFVDGHSLESVFEKIAEWEAEAADKEAADKEASLKNAEACRLRLEQNVQQLQGFVQNQNATFKTMQEGWDEVFLPNSPTAVGRTFTITNWGRFFDDPAHIAAAEAEIARRQSAVADAKEAEKIAAAAAVAALRQWAIENGSDLVKLRIEEGMNWRDMARAEWGGCQFPMEWQPWGEFIASLRGNDPEGWVIKDATTEQILELRAAREQYPLAEEITLRRVKDVGRYDGDETTHYDVLNVVLIAPDGGKCDYVKVLSTK